MPKISPTAKSLLLPLILLVGLLAVRKYFYEFGTSGNQILLIDEGRFYLFDEILQCHIDFRRRDTENIIKQMILSKHQDSLEIETTLKNIQKEINYYYTLPSDIRMKLIQSAGGMTETGKYVNFGKRLKIENYQIEKFYNALLDDYVYHGSKVGTYKDLAADHKENKIEMEEFVKLYDEAPLVVHFLNLDGFKLKMAHLEQDIILHLAKEKGIILK